MNKKEWYFDACDTQYDWCREQGMKCKANINDRDYGHPIYGMIIGIFLYDETDAVAFKLRWC